MMTVSRSSIAYIFWLIDIQYLTIVLILTCLVEHTEYLIQTIIYMSVQARYLHDDTIMRQTIYKRIRKTLCHLVPFIIEGIMF